jgi:hypothetical protein
MGPFFCRQALSFVFVLLGSGFQRLTIQKKSFSKAFRCSKACPPLGQGCQMVCFQTKSTDLGKFWKALD